MTLQDNPKGWDYLKKRRITKLGVRITVYAKRYKWFENQNQTKMDSFYEVEK